MRHLSMLAVVVVGCGSVTALPDAGDGSGDDAGGEPEIDGVRSGTRLEVEWYDFGGTRVWSRLYDSVRREHCYVTEWLGGQRFCTPADSAQVVYADAGCTQKFGQIYVPAGCTRTPPGYIMEYEQQACSTRPSRLYQRGARSAVTQYYHRSADGSCNGPYGAANYEFYALGTEIPTSELAPVMISAPVGSGRIGIRYHESPDGMRMPFAAHDAQLGTDCYMSYDLGDQTARCLPSSAGYASYFGNPSCTEPKLSHYAPPGSQCPEPQYVVRRPDQCVVTDDDYFEIGAETAGDPLYYASNNTCNATTPSPNSKYFRVGAPLTLATATRAPDPSEHRIRTIHHDAGGTSIRDYALWDSVKNTDCYPQVQSDGSVRCLPIGGTSVRSMYTDPECATAVDIVDVYRGPAGCAPPPLAPFAIKYGTCNRDNEVYTVGAPHTGPLYTNYGTCQLYTPTQTIPYRVGALVPIEEFAIGTTVID